MNQGAEYGPWRQSISPCTRACSSREGTANGAGERGNYINCTYRMNDSALGSGKCRMNDGAEFAMHIGG